MAGVPPRSLLVVLFAAVALAWAWGRPAAAATPDEIQLIATLINQERQRVGLPPLTLDARLSAAAQFHSEDMATHNFVSHRGSDGRNYWDRVNATNYGPMYVGEVITAGQADVRDVVRAWTLSAPHFAILLRAEALDVGVGHAANSASQYGNYWTVTVGRPANVVTSAPPTPTPSGPMLAYPVPGVAPTATPSPMPTIGPTPYPPEIVARMRRQIYLPTVRP